MRPGDRGLHPAATMSPAIPYRPPAMEATNLANLYQLPLLDWASIEDKLRSGVEPGAGLPAARTVIPAG